MKTSLRCFQLIRHLPDRCYIIEIHQVSVAGQSVAFLAVYQDLDPSQPWDIRRQSLHQRSHCQFLNQYTGTMTVCKGAVHINDRKSRFDKIDVLHFGSRTHLMRRSFIKIHAEQRS